MAGMAGSLQRPVFAVAAVAAASVSTDLPNKFHNSKSSDHITTTTETQKHDSLASSSWASNVPSSKLAKLSFVTRIGVPVPDVNMLKTIPSRKGHPMGSFPDSSFATSPVLLKFYQSADLARSAKPTRYSPATTSSPSSSEELYRWHLPDPNFIDVSGNNSSYSYAKCKTVVVLLGWLGAKQKHLNRYAEFYTSRGYHAITFTFPMSEVLSYQVGGKAEQDIELLVSHLADWLEEEQGKNLVFHTFSNTGWLTYGVVLENLQKLDPSLLGKIKGCVVDSAPVATPDAQVWASGFSAAFLKKQSSATKGSKVPSDSTTTDASMNTKTVVTQHKPPVTEAALLAILGKFFSVVLNIPSVNRRLTDVMGLLSSKQPSCPQLYIYSSADRVIPADAVESFVEKQRKNGLEVRACNFISTPHVDHFRNNPQLYESELTLFLDDFVLKSCKGASC